MQRKSKSNAFKDNFQELLNFVSDSIMVFNQEGVVLAASKTAGIPLGIASEELIGNHIEDLKTIDEKQRHLLKISSRKESKAKKSMDFSLARCKRSLRHMREQ